MYNVSYLDSYNTLDLQISGDVISSFRRSYEKHLCVGRGTHLEEPLQPPDLEYALPNQDTQLKDTPPLHSSIRALCRIPVRAFSNYDVRLLVFDLRKEVGERFHYVCQQSASHPANHIPPASSPAFPLIQPPWYPRQRSLMTGLTDLLAPEDHSVPATLAHILCHAH